MPSRLQRHLRTASRVVGESYICPSCLHKQSGEPLLRLSRSFHGPRKRVLYTTSTSALNSLEPGQRSKTLHQPFRQLRQASNGSLASSTAINAPNSVPPSLRELRNSLLALQDSASSYIDRSRLSLAVRSLEGEKAVTCVALLGLGDNGALAARKLVRVLLADPLAIEQPWEKEVIQSAREGRNVIIKYGDPGEDTSMQNGHMTVLQTVLVPSTFLQKNNLEILVTTSNARGAALDNVQELQDNVLVPTLILPASSGGRMEFLRYPVHKAIIVAEGVAGAVEYGKFPQGLVDGDLIRAALSIPLRPASGAETGEAVALDDAVDVDLATHALALFRTNNANGAQFSSEWQTSRLSIISDWLANGQIKPRGSNLSPTVDRLVQSVVSRASTSLIKAEAEETTVVKLATVSDSKRDALNSAISNWSADAHRDLQNNLDIALVDSASWRRTVWWRLFWRIDDVSVSLFQLLRRSWLNEAEQRMAFLSGRIAEANLATEDILRAIGSVPQLDEDRKEAMSQYEALKSKTETYAELTQLPALLARMHDQSGVDPLYQPPWPQTIHLSRQYMLHTLVPALHRKAQSLLLTSLSTVGGSAALSAWFYVATAGTGVYESGAIFSLGLVWALRRLQKSWGKERDEFAGTVREDGRKALAEVETALRTIVRNGGRAAPRAEDLRMWEETRASLHRCEEALRRVADRSH